MGNKGNNNKKKKLDGILEAVGDLCALIAFLIPFIIKRKN